MRGTWRIVAGLALVAGGLAARLAGQDPAPAEPEKPEAVKERIRQARQDMEQDRKAPSNVQVRLELRNGEVLTGIVRAGRFVERRQGRDYVRAEKEEPGAGMRIWYYNNTSSEIFILYKDIGETAVLRRLSDLELAEHGKKIREEEERVAAAARERARARIQALKERARAEADPEKEAEAKAKEAQEREAAARAERAALLKEFPPAEGWGPERVKEIETRKIVLGVFPSKQESRFLELFALWQQALQESAPPPPAPQDR